MIENFGFTFITINPDVENFDLDVKTAKIYNYIKESSVKLAVNSSEKLLNEKNYWVTCQVFVTFKTRQVFY